MQAERNEERARATEKASAVQDLQRQVREAEGQVTQLRKQRRDDQRWFTREKTSLTERVTSLETEKVQKDSAVGKMKVELRQHTAELAKRDKRVKELEKLAQEKDSEVCMKIYCRQNCPSSQLN